VASVTLSGFYQCGYIAITNDDLVSETRRHRLCSNESLCGWLVLETFSCDEQVQLFQQDRRQESDVAREHCQTARRFARDESTDGDRTCFLRCARPVRDRSFESIRDSDACARSVDVAVRSFARS
jgi:hypothetical protein